MLALLRPRCKKLTDFSTSSAVLRRSGRLRSGGVKKHLSTPGRRTTCWRCETRIRGPSGIEAALEKTLRDLADARTIKAGMLIHGTRIAMTGRMVSPGLFEMLVLLGRETVLRRLDRLAATL